MLDVIRTPVIGGNWKLNTNRIEAQALLQELRGRLDGLIGVEIFVCPPTPWLGDAADALSGSTLSVGAQNVYWEDAGAFTGEQSAAILADTTSHVIVGHSERRHVFGERDEDTRLKLSAVLNAGLHPVLAIGELQQERESGATLTVLRRQLMAAFEDRSTIPEGFIIAYEPVWAIGTGLSASPGEAGEACAAVRAIVAERFDDATALSVRVQYGGSVTPDNVAELASQPDVDGALVGGASLQADSFVAICHAIAENSHG